MPYADLERRRAVQRDSARRRRAGESTLRQPVPEIQDLQLESARDALAVLRVELARVQGIKDKDASTIMQRARTVAGLLVTFLRAVEIAEIIPRLEALEGEAARRKEGYQ